MKITTREQRKALKALFDRGPVYAERDMQRGGREFRKTYCRPLTYLQFRRTFRWYLGDYIGGDWCGMFIGIERDGYTHS